MKNTSNKKIILLITVIIVLILAIVGIGLAIFLQFGGNNIFPGEQTTVAEVATSDNVGETDSSGNKVLVDNPIDFAALQKENSDLYAWITIPNTAVDYVIAQAGDDNNDLFYLNHNMYREYEFAGTIYSEKQNAKDFSDPITVLYGHKMLNGTMFAGLKQFANKTFFDENKYFYIYTPGHILTYEIFSAYTYDNRHILNNFDFSDRDVYAEYIDYATDASANGGYVRQDITIDTNDRIVVLSTCANGGKDRYLVQGVLIKDEETK